MLYFAFLIIGLCHLGSGALDHSGSATPQPSFQNPAYKQNKTQINDADYWDFDDFVPFKEDRHDSFDWKLLKEVLLSEPTNVIVSPFSVKLVLALLSEGAGAETITKRELSTVLPNIRSPTLAREYYKKVITSLSQPNKNYELNIGSKIFVDQFIEPRQRFASIAEAHYGASVERLVFQNAQASADHINRWCNNVTNGHIPHLVHKDVIASSVMVIANAIFFDGVWRKPFQEDASYNFVFYRTPQQEVTVTYMTQLGNFYFFDSKKLNCKFIRLPYRGKKFAMTIILPGAKGGLDELIREIEGDGLKRLQWLMEETTVKVTLPRFQFDYTSQLKDTLENLGIQEIFTANASLPGLARGQGLNNQLRVSHVIQKSGLIVNEKGTTAFAATDVVLSNKFGDTTIQEFNANRPFLFMIEDETTATMLFAGKVTDPTKH